ncbi:MAG TPA: hypothetical protein VGR64_01215 [Terracidiphilus sp.]|nr:hypothetical protein [Terracidiphilus sp.]
MKSSRAAASGPDLSQLSIPDAETIIEEALSELSYSQDPGLARALKFLAPAGYQVIVELCSENGRSKRRTDSAANWSPEDDEVRIYFERLDGNDAAPRMTRIPRAMPEAQDEDEDGERRERPRAEFDGRVRELCGALAEAERGGHAFIALKWFRDSFLPRKNYSWNHEPESRQAVLAEAIQRGVILTSKIANPKSPSYPTTTIRLNRAEAGIPEEAQRFHPVTVEGETVVATIDEERGGE